MPVVPVWGYDEFGQWEMLNRPEFERWQLEQASIAAARRKAVSKKRRGWLFGKEKSGQPTKVVDHRLPCDIT